MTGEYGRTSQKLDFWLRSSLVASIPSLFDILSGPSSHDKFAGHDGKFSWSSTCIFELEFCGYECSPVCKYEIVGNIHTANKDPSPLVGFHGVQLTLHDGQLFTENNRTNYASNRNDGGQPDYPSVASIYSINKRLIGYCSLIFVLITMFGGIYLLFNFDRWLLGRRNTALLGIGLIMASVGIASQGVPLIFGY